MEFAKFMNAQPKISIITVVKNGERCILKTINSVLKQTYSNIEYLVIDGNSEDNTKKILQDYNNLIDLIVSCPDNGIYDGMNKGIKLSTGDYITFLNCGDYYPCKDTIQKIFGKTDKQNKKDIIYGNILLTNKIDQKIKTVYALPLTIENLIKEGTRTMCHQAVFVKKKIVPFFDTNYKLIADLNWYFDLLNQNDELNIKHMDEVVVCYCIGGLSSTKKLYATIERFKIIRLRFGNKVMIKNMHYFLKPILYSLVSYLGLKKYPVI